MFLFGLDNEEQHIFTFCAFFNQKLHQYAGKTLDRITTSVIITRLTFAGKSDTSLDDRFFFFINAQFWLH